MHRLFTILALLLLTGCEPTQTSERVHIPMSENADVSTSEPGKYGGIFVLTDSSEPKTFNPLAATDVYSMQAITQVLRTLASYNPITAEHIPALASSWEVGPDQMTYIFHLREGVRWSDGTPFTADDVLFTFDAIFDERYPSRYEDQFTIGGEYLRYEKLDDYTVVFKTATIYAPFINDIGGMEILPKHKLQEAFDNGELLKAWTTQTAIDNPESLVGTGPFLVHSYVPGERLVLKPNPYYWRVDTAGNRLPYIDFLIFKFVADANAEIALFATGQADATGLGPQNYAWVKKAADIYDFTLHHKGPDAGISFMWFNQHPGKDDTGTPYIPEHKFKWFTNKLFRQAVMHGIDREGIIDAIYFGKGEALHSIISPANTKWHNPNTRKYAYDPERSKQTLLAAGFEYRGDKLYDADGNRVSIELLSTDGSQLITTLVVTFIDNMADIGIDIKLVYMDFGAMLGRIKDTFDYDMAIMGFSGGGDPSGGKAIYKSSGDLHNWYPNQPEPATAWEREVDRIFELQERELDEAKRIALIHQMQTIFSEELPLLFLFNPTVYAGIQNKWNNVQVPPLGSVIWNLDELWTETPNPSL